MRRLMAALIALLAVLPAHAKPLKAVDFHSTDGVLRWINGYRAKPAPHSVPAAMRALSRLGGLQDSERAGVYVGFLAGIVGSNPVAADADDRPDPDHPARGPLDRRARDRLFGPAGLAGPAAQICRPHAGTADDDREISDREKSHAR